MLLTTCRSNEEFVNFQQEKDIRFAVFVPQDGEKINYADGFAYLMKRYDSIHKTNYTGFNRSNELSTLGESKLKAQSLSNNEAYIDFNIRSQTITEENGDKWVVYPQIQGAKVTDLYVAIIDERKENLRRGFLLRGTNNYEKNKRVFQKKFDERRTKKISMSMSQSISAMAASPCGQGEEYCDVGEVVITKPRQGGDWTGFQGGGGIASNDGCRAYEMCESDHEGGGGRGSNTPPADRCMKAKAPTQKADATPKAAKVDSKAKALAKKAKTESAEYAITISRENGELKATDPYTDGNNGSAHVKAPTSGDYVANGHSHPAGGAVPPSAADFYTTLNIVSKYPTFTAGYVFASNGATYALVVTDREAAIAFLTKYPEATTLTENRQLFKRNTDMGNDFMEIYRNFSSGANPNYSGNEQNDGLETALSHVLDKYNAGIALVKADANNNLKSLNATAFQYEIPVSGGKIVTAYKTQNCQ